MEPVRSRAQATCFYFNGTPLCVTRCKCQKGTKSKLQASVLRAVRLGVNALLSTS